MEGRKLQSYNREAIDSFPLRISAEQNISMGCPACIYILYCNRLIFMIKIKLNMVKESYCHLNGSIRALKNEKA